MISDVEGLAWLRGLDAEWGKSTVGVFEEIRAGKRREYTVPYQGPPTKSITQPEYTRECMAHILNLVEKRVRFSEANAEAIRRANQYV